MDVLGARQRTRLINETCDCTTLDRDALARSLLEKADPEYFADIWQSHPHLFSEAPAYVCRDDLRIMEGVVSAVEALAAHPAYREEVSERAPEIAGKDFGPRGALMGYDFHLSPEGPRLIEINTNAGGAFLNAAACEAQRLCCEGAASVGEIACPRDLSVRLAEMFVAEWRLQGREGRPGLIAIVDDNPGEQYLYPEFLLAVGTLKARGLDAVVADPAQLSYRGGRLWFGDRAVDLVYNRLVDFYLAEPSHAAIRDAYVGGDVVVTPNPFHHALFADKRNLITLSDPERLRAFDLKVHDVRALKAVPTTLPVTPGSVDALWADRNRLFFKPVAGHGSKAVYRGDKITKRVWSEIVAGGYVAQERVAPSERIVALPGGSVRQKMDVRLYTYAGETLLAVARLYQGQTTNFRTPGGGFAPVMVI